jgi:xanthosine utilization system XapX-like protein
MTDPAQANPITIAIIGLVGVFIGAVITSISQWWMQHRTEKQERSFITSNLVAALDQLAIDCARTAYDDGTVDGQPSEDGYHSIQVLDPEFSLTNDHANFKHLDASTTYKVLVIPHRIMSISHSVLGEWEHDDPPNFLRTFETRQHSFAQLGIDITLLSDEIRRKYGIPDSPSEIWKPMPNLQEIITAINERRLKRMLPPLTLNP